MKLLGIDLGQVGALGGQLRDAHIDKSRVLAYMRAGHIVLAARGLTGDRVDSAGPPIPIAFATDGAWLWSWEAVEYVDRHDLALPMSFLDHIVARGVPPEVGPNDIEEALAVLGVEH